MNFCFSLFHSTIVKSRGEAVDHKMTEESSFSQDTPKEQEVTKKQPSTDEAASDGTIAQSQGKSHKHTVLKDCEFDNSKKCLYCLFFWDSRIPSLLPFCVLTYFPVEHHHHGDEPAPYHFFHGCPE